jgi:beta-lactamase regulating signal transducer with metallopeptidase domain
VDGLLNWLWQGSVVALAATAIIQSSRTLSATTRYHLWWLTLLLVLALPILPDLQVPRAAASLPVDATSAPQPAWSAPLPGLPAWAKTVVTVLWAAWVTLSLWRVGHALVSLRRAKHDCSVFPPSRETRLRTWISLRVTGRRARLVVSEHVRSAGVFGLASPAVAVSRALLQALKDDELDQIVVHEWAHIQRRDDVGRFLQVLVRALAGLHPAVWWIDRQLEIEREVACDDWVLKVTGSPRSYATCLTRIAELPGRGSGLMVVPGVLSSSQLTRRVVRLLDHRRNTSVRRSLVAIALASPLIVTATMMAARVQFVNSAVRVTASVEPGASSAPMSLNSPLRGEDRGHGVGTAVSRSMNRPALKGPSARLSGRPRLPEASSSDSVVPAGKPKSRVPQARTDADADSHEPAVVAATRLELPVAQELPVALTAGGVLPTVPSAVDSSASPGAAGSTPWGAAADAGVAVGRGSQKAAVSTAGVFTRFAKSIAGNF